MKYSSGKGPGSNDDEYKLVLLLWEKPDVQISVYVLDTLIMF